LKKLLLILAVVLMLGVSGCTKYSKQTPFNEKSITITREKFDKVEEMRDRLQGNYTGIFKVNNLAKGKYKVTIFIEEYNNGKLKESRDILGDEIEIKDENDNLYVGVNKNINNLTFDISHINKDISNSATSSDISFDDDEKSGHSWSMLENNNDEVHNMKLDKEISIASVSIGNENITYGISVGEDAKKPSEYNFDGGSNSKDLVAYLKINKIK